MTAILMNGVIAAGMYAGIHDREVQQQRRIAQGVHSGSLTRGETARLEARERSLHREIRRDRIDGGGLSVAERAKIHQRQDRLSREIWRQKHDRQRR